MADRTPPQRLSTGVDGLDEVLDGGLFPSRACMVTGDLGTGKTILGMHYLTTGRDAGDTGLFGTSDFERTLREFEITTHGIKVGEPLRDLRGVLSGTPEFVDSTRVERSSGVVPGQ